MIKYIICFTIGLIIGYVTKVLVEKKSQEELIKLKTQLDTYKNLEKMLKDDFSKIARNAIKEEQDDFRKQHQETLELKLAPLTKELGEFKTKVENFNLSGEKNTVALIEKITTLEKSTAQITKEANQLATALTTNQNVKGAYGEGLLENILEFCGMKEGIHYSKQFVTKATDNNEEEHIIRPDVVINLPNSRHLIIDSKMTLSSYLEFINNEENLPKFKAEVKKRLIELSNKNYQNTADIYQPDFVLMYIPIENALHYLYEDNDLINKAYKSNVVIVGTSSILTTIRLVNQLMAQEKQQESVNKIVTAGTNLYETFAKFCDDLLDVKKRFEALDIQFNKTINRFKRGNKTNPSLFSQIETLKDYGITTNKEIPQELLEEIVE